MKTRIVLADVVGVASPSRKTEKPGFILDYPGMEKEDNGVRRLSVNVLDAIAENCGFPDHESLFDIIRMSLDKGQLEIKLEERKKGEKWEDKASGRSGVFEKDHEAIVGIPVYIPSDEIIEEIKLVNREILREKLREKKDRKRSSPKKEVLTNPFGAPAKNETENAETSQADKADDVPFG